MGTGKNTPRHDSFDQVVTTFVFCSVPDPVRGFMEVGRVLRPDGRGIFVEHVLSRMPAIRQGMNALNPLVRTIMGANINRQTRDNIGAAGLIVESEAECVKTEADRLPIAGFARAAGAALATTPPWAAAAFVEAWRPPSLSPRHRAATPGPA